MCGIAGIARASGRAIAPDALGRMAAALRHRGPDGYGFYVSPRVGFAHTRLSIIDVANGAQPLANEDGQVVVTFNGEIYNYRELGDELTALGHRFRTRCDTEVLVHGYEEWGKGLLGRLNGQFAFALHDARDGSVFLARDRFGVRPLFYAWQGGDLVFASEAKALFATGEVSAEPDPAGLDEIFTWWGARPPRTPFRDVRSLEPGTCARWRDGTLVAERYYTFEFPEAGEERPDAIEQLDALLRDSVALRMRADVPVGAYLSGGLDSSITAALAAERTPHQLRTFSVTFDDPRYDESPFQRQMAAAVGSEHAVQHIGDAEIARYLPDVVRHVETPLTRTAPVPMYLLAKLTRERGIKVVLTGEGADELFLGYDLFKETLVRWFCLRAPDSKVRPRLFDRLYPTLFGATRGEFWRRFFLEASALDDPLFSHRPRFGLTAWIKEFYGPELRASLAGVDPVGDLRAALPEGFGRWSLLNRADYLELVTLLSPYLLAAQGDRVAMAHGVEGRFPFLDHRLFEFAAALPTRSRLRGLREKAILRRWAAEVIPAIAVERPKQPYRAPDIPPFFAPGAPEYVRDALDETSVRAAGFFDPRAVAGLVRRCRAGQATAVREAQALVGILTTQLWHQAFRGGAHAPALSFGGADVVVRAAQPALT